MNSNRKKSIAIGSLLISGMVAGIFSVAPAVDDPAFLVKAAAHSNQVMLGAIFQLLMAVAYLGVGVLLYSVLRKYSGTLALGFLSFRIVASVCIVIGTIFLLLILTLSQEFVGAAPGSASYFESLGNLLRTGRDLVNHVIMILTLGIGGLMVYPVLFRTRLIPRWLSVWGFLGTALTMLASLLVLFHCIEIITPAYIILNVPIAPSWKLLWLFG